MIEWQMAAIILSVVSPLVLVVVTYVKTWAKLDGTLSVLSVTVDKLSRILEGLRTAQNDMQQRMVKEETRVSEMERRIDKIERRMETT